MSDKNNLILAIVLSLAVLVVFDILAPKPELKAPAQQAQDGQTLSASHVPAAPPAPNAVPTPRKTPAQLHSARVAIKTPTLQGSIALTGAVFNELALSQYKLEVRPDSAPVDLLQPPSSSHAYYAEFGWVAPAQNIAVPTASSIWTADRTVLTPNQPVTLRWNNGQGLTFIRRIAADDHYLFTVTDTVRNATKDTVTLRPYGLITRTHHSDGKNSSYILHEGPLAVLDGTLKEISYKNLHSKGREEYTSTGGWIGVADKYWLTAITLDPSTKSKARFLFTGSATGDADRYQTDFLGAQRTIAADGSMTVSTHFFAGPKELALLDRYATAYGINHFDLAIDFGWFYFLTKPFFLALRWLHGFLGNFGLAIIAFTAALRVLMYPLARKSYASMHKMKTLQPVIKDIQTRFKDDRPRMQQEIMNLYKSKGANPVAGCLPMLIQIPIFFALYKVLFVSIEMRHAPFCLWIRDLSAPDPTSVFNLFGLIPWQPPSFLAIGVLPLIMGFTMWAQQKMNPAPPDPTQARVLSLLPFVFTIMLAHFPAGLVLYWTCNNTLSVLQQWVIARRFANSQTTGSQ